MISITQLALCTGAKKATATLWLLPIISATTKYQINLPRRVAGFLGQCGHESAGLTHLRESMNYTPDALIATFGKRITRVDASRYGRIDGRAADQEMIANIVYAGRMGNGPMESGEGWKFRAGGPLGLTGRDNYTACGAALGIDLVGNPDLIERPDIGALSAGWFWDINKLNALADVGDWVGISGAVNCGSAKVQPSRIIGLPQRLAMMEAGLRALS